jgi:hypothetical protein
MNATRECFVLPGIFLTVALLGGFRVESGVRLVPPPLLALTLGLLLLGALANSRVFEPGLLLNERRTPLENTSGLILMLTLFAACTQVFNLVTPDEGLLHGIFGTFFLVQVLTTFASVRTRRDMLRNLGVLFGAAFVLRFIVLEALYAPDGGALKRLLTALMQAGSLGTLTYRPNAGITGYIAFATLVAFLFGLFLLGGENEQRKPDALVEVEVSPLAPADHGKW